MNVHAAFLPSAARLLVLLPSLAMAQQQPLTGRMMQGYQPTTAVPAAQPLPRQAVIIPAALAPPAAVAGPSLQQASASAPAQSPQPPVDDEAPYVPESADAVAAAPAFHNAQVGDTTSRLLRMQADGLRAGRALPMLGDEASAGYRRYLKSFDHEIPEFYEVAVGKDSGNGR